MRPSRLFWGALFIVLGVLFLLQRVFLLDLAWEGAWRYWPVVLVIWGAALILRDKRAGAISAALAGAVMAVVVFGVLEAGWGWGWPEGWIDRSAAQEQQFTEPYDSTIHRASFTFESGAGSFRLGGTTGDLMAATTRSSVGSYALTRSQQEGTADLVLSFTGERRRWTFGGARHEADVRLNAGPLWDIRFGLGAAKLDADLSELKVDRVIVKTGAADVRIKLGMPQHASHLAVSMGAATVKVEVPDAAGCEVRTKTALARKRLSEFVRIEKGLYRTAAFDSAQQRIFISVEGGISNVRVVRY